MPKHRDGGLKLERRVVYAEKCTVRPWEKQQQGIVLLRYAPYSTPGDSRLMDKSVAPFNRQYHIV